MFGDSKLRHLFKSSLSIRSFNSADKQAERQADSDINAPKHAQLSRAVPRMTCRRQCSPGKNMRRRVKRHRAASPSVPTEVPWS